MVTKVTKVPLFTLSSQLSIHRLCTHGRSNHFCLASLCTSKWMPPQWITCSSVATWTYMCSFHSVWNDPTLMQKKLNRIRFHKELLVALPAMKQCSTSQVQFFATGELVESFVQQIVCITHLLSISLISLPVWYISKEIDPFERRKMRNDANDASDVLQIQILFHVSSCFVCILDMCKWYVFCMYLICQWY
jgi:hypothetical protein